MDMVFFNGCDPEEEDLQLDLLNKIGCLPEIERVSDEFADLLRPLSWELRKRLDDLFGEIQVACIEAAYAAGVTASRLPPTVINEN